MILAVLQERTEHRVAVVPAVAQKIADQGVEVWVEKGAGANATFTDAQYESASIKTRDEILSQADVLVSIEPLPEEEWAKAKPGALLISEFKPFVDETIAERIEKAGLRALSLDMIPRTTLAQSMDVLSSMASIAGYQAVIIAAEHLPRYFPMMITAAGSLKRAKVLVLGAGVAGLQSVATAKRLGAQVEAFDTRSAAKEEVMSLGAKFIEVEGAAEDTGAGGYAVEQSEEFLNRQREEVQNRASKSDVIITTAQVRGRKAPVLVPVNTVEKMKAGSVIIDLASSTGGNCPLSRDREVVRHQGVTIIGDSNLADRMPQDASTLYANNLFNLLKIMITAEGQLHLDKENEIIDSAMITKL